MLALSPRLLDVPAKITKILGAQSNTLTREINLHRLHTLAGGGI